MDSFLGKTKRVRYIFSTEAENDARLMTELLDDPGLLTHIFLRHREDIIATRIKRTDRRAALIRRLVGM